MDCTNKDYLRVAETPEIKGRVSGIKTVEDYMRKHAMILALVLALIMGLVFIGCGGNLGQIDVTNESGRASAAPDVTLFEIPIAANDWGPNGPSGTSLNGCDLEYKLTFKTINAQMGTTFGIPSKGDKLTFFFTVIPSDDVSGTPSNEGGKKEDGTPIEAGEITGDQLTVFLLSNTPAEGYWNELGVWSDVEGGEATKASKKYRLAVEELTKGEEITFGGTITVKPKKDIEAKDVENISLVFRIDGRSQTKPVTLKVKELSFK
jgi:hypothetical protein